MSEAPLAPHLELSLDFVRAHFPGLGDAQARPPVLADNAGGSVPCRAVVEAASHYLGQHMVQLGASYSRSQAAQAAVEAGKLAAARLVGATPEQMVLNGSTTANVYLLARAMAPLLEAGDALVITRLDHEANVGAWRRLAARGVEIRVWDFDPADPRLTLEGLEPLLDARTKLVCFTQVSNVVGAIHEVPALCARIREAGAISVVDGVAYAPHRRVDVQALGCDVYLSSLYKVYGPHVGSMWIRPELMARLAPQNHEFIADPLDPYKLEPGNVNHELCASLVGIEAYLRAVAEHHGDDPAQPHAPVFARFAAHEARLAARLLDFLRSRPEVEIVGPASADPELRVPTIAFGIRGHRSSALVPHLDARGIGIRWGDFYAKGAIARMGREDRDGVVRVSLVHYNRLEEVDRIIEGLEAGLDALGGA